MSTEVPYSHLGKVYAMLSNYFVYAGTRGITLAHAPLELGVLALIAKRAADGVDKKGKMPPLDELAKKVEIDEASAERGLRFILKQIPTDILRGFPAAQRQISSN